MQQGSGKKRLHLFATDLEMLAHLRRIYLSTANVAMSGMVFRVYRNRQRLNCVHVNGCHFLDVPALVRFCTPHFLESLLVKPVQQMDETRNQQTKQDEGQARTMQGRVEKDCGSGARNLSRKRPNNTFLGGQDSWFTVDDV